MIPEEEIRSCALALPDVNEGTHFGLPSFKVGEKGFVVIQKGGTHAILSVDEAHAHAAAEEDADAFQVVRRNSGSIFVGVRVELARASASRVRELIEAAWRHKAPKRLVAAYDSGR